MHYGLVERKGAWYSYADVRVSGMDNFTSALTSGGKIKELEQAVYSAMEKETADES